MPLDALLNPRSVAVLGASERPSAGRRVLNSLTRFGFQGDIFPVNPRYEELSGFTCYPSLRDLPQAPDVVAFCIGAARTAAAMEEAAAVGARAAVIFDGGFAERGTDGRALQRRLEVCCKEAGIALCGPNCMGVLSPWNRSSVYLQELRDPEGLAGNVGLISQSGSICIGILADVRRFGFSHVISSGNEAVVTASDFLETLVDDPKTRVIGLFLESVREPERFVAALDRAADRGKPVVVLKVGRAERTRRAITSHTGGLAGSSQVFAAVLRAHRAIAVSDLDEFTEVLAACQAERWPAGPRIAVITGSGGQAELILDVATEAGLALPPLPETCRTALEQLIGSVPGDGNPLDAWGNGDVAANYPHALRVLRESGAYDAIVLSSDTADASPMGALERLLQPSRLAIESAGESAVPHFVMGMRPGVMMRTQVNLLRDSGLMYVCGTRQGLGALDRLGRWSQPPSPPRAARPLSGPGVAGARRTGRRTVNEHDAKRILAAEGLPVTREWLVTDRDAARQAAETIGYPVVLKAVSDDIPHKSEFGLVAVDLTCEAALDHAWANMQQRLAGRAVQGFLVQEMVSGGIEVFAGLSRDSCFGLVLAFGLGGTNIELTRDTALRTLPLREGDAAAMLAEIRAAPLLFTPRSGVPYDIPALAACLEGFADYAWADRDNLAEIDLNPIKLLRAGQGCRIVDSLIVAAPRHEDTA